MIDVRLRSVVPPDELEEKIGKVLTDADVNLLLTGPARVRKPDGSPLCVYRPGIIPPELRESTWPILAELRKEPSTMNRGNAAGSPRLRMASGRSSQARPVKSAIVGAFEGKTFRTRGYCRLTAWTGRETEKYRILWPLLQFIGERLREDVPERWAAQMAKVTETRPDWVIPGTPFTTVTVNNSYETGVHVDKGDLDEGFSTLAVFRRGEYRGGFLVFPEYRVGVDMQDGDLLLMDAHAWHGNTFLEPRPRYSSNGTRLDLGSDGLPSFERVSVVSYFRSRMVMCEDAETEAEKARVYAEQRSQTLLGE